MRPTISKTQFGQRLTVLREALGFKTRKEFSNFLDIHPETLGGYERGDSTPDIAFLAMYKQRFSVNMNWLIDGIGEIFITKDSQRLILHETIRSDVMAEIANHIENTYPFPGKKLDTAHFIGLSVDIYNHLVAAQTDFTDHDEIDAAIRLECIKLNKKRMAQ